MLGHCINTGKCCELIIMHVNQKRYNEIEKHLKKSGDPDSSFIEKNFTIISDEEAMVIRPSVKVGIKARNHELENGDGLFDAMGHGLMFLKCKQYNDKLKKCMDYKNRPKVCREFPFYGDELDITATDKKVSKSCGYLIHHPDYKKLVNKGKNSEKG